MSGGPDGGKTRFGLFYCVDFQGFFLSFFNEMTEGLISL